MVTRRPNWWMRDKEGLGLWEHRGKVAVAGIGHPPMDRRWDGVSMDKTLGAYSIIAAQKAMDDAGVTADQVDGVITCPGPLGDYWKPRPYFAPPYESEDGLTLVTAEWLAKGLGLKNVKYFESRAPQIGMMMGMAAQAVGDGLCNTCLVLYPTGNLPGRYHHVDENEADHAHGNHQWHFPWGHQDGFMQNAAFVFTMYCRKYGRDHDGLAPFHVNQRRNGLRTPWGYYTNHEPYQTTVEDYKAARWIAKPICILDCDRPVNTAAAYVFTTAERAKNMKQKPVYVLNHAENNYRSRSTFEPLSENEAWTDSLARKVQEGSGLSINEVDVFNPYDGFLVFVQTYLEAFRWHGVKRGEAHDFYAGGLKTEGPHPFLPSGGNNGTGRTRTAIFTDTIEQLRGQAGVRQLKNRADTGLAGAVSPASSGWVTFSKNPS